MKTKNNGYVMVNLNNISLTPFNPKNRVQGNKQKELVKSLSEHGQIIPVILTSNGLLADGNRRVLGAKELGWKQVKAIYTDKEVEEVYQVVNTHFRKFSENDTIGIWLENKNAVSSQIGKKYEEIQKMFGRDLMLKIYRQGISPRIFRVAIRISKYTGEENTNFVKTAVKYMMNITKTKVIEHYMDSGESPKNLKLAVETNRPLKIKYLT